jgi:hypothetical protein
VNLLGLWSLGLQELWQAIAAARDEGNGEASDNLTADEDSTPQLEVDPDDCALLQDHLLRKLQTLEDSDSKSEALLRPHLGQNADPRALFIRAYRDGQRRILTETIESLNLIMPGDDDEGDDSETGEEEDDASMQNSDQEGDDEESEQGPSLSESSQDNDTGKSKRRKR